MRSYVRISLSALICGVLLAALAPAAAQAAFGVGTFAAVNCKFGHEQCASFESPGPFGTPYSFPKEPKKPEAEVEGFTQAGGRVPYGVTDFELNTTGTYPTAKPEGAPVSHVRVDVATGLATAPVAVPLCSLEEFGATEALPGTGLYVKSLCKASTEIGTEQVTLYVKELEEKVGVGDLPLAGKVYNLVQPKGLASYYGAALAFPKVLTEAKLFEAFKGSQPAIEKEQYYVHSFVKGNVEWGKQGAGTSQGDYHDYFEVEASPADPLISSRQVLYGTSGAGNFITNATNCPGDNTTFVTLENTSKETNRKSFTTPVGLGGCNLVPFAPSFSLTPGTTQLDQPDGFTAEAAVPQEPTMPIGSSELKTAVIKLPEGMTINPSAAAGLAACTVAQARIHSEKAGTECPSASELGTVSLEVPTLPPGSFTGKIYLGGPVTGPETGPITGPPYIIYLDAESARYGISVRVKGEVTPNETTGQLTTVFNENPEQPFTNVVMHFKEGALAPVANPLVCGLAKTETTFTPFSGTAAQTPFTEFKVDSNGKGGSCSSPIPFAPSQGQAALPLKAGAQTAYTFNLERTDGQQYLTKVKTVFPPGLAGLIPKVQQCSEVQATSGTCPAASQIGTVVVASGAGPTPYQFTGQVFLTGPYKGAPYGMAIVVPTIAGPFNLGPAIARSTINVEPISGRVVVTSEVPTIVKGGVPTRMKRIGVSINRPGFLENPTNCGVLATESLVSGSLGGTASLSTPFQAEGCSSLAFKPTFTAKTSAKTSKANGASIETTLNMASGGANVKSVLVQLPKQLPSRLTTLQKACLQATFEANPFHCPEGSFVGGARANTPLLPSKMTGPAILVSHAGAAFPDLDLVLQADGVRVILIGNTDIKKGITTTNFASTPDAPVTSVTVNLPLGPHSALATERLTTNLCTANLVMPTTITAQNGKQTKQNTVIQPVGCGVQIVGHKVIGNTAYLTVKTFAGGRISGSGSGLNTVTRSLKNASKSTSLPVSLSSAGRSSRPFSTKIRVGFVGKKKGEHSNSYVTVRFG
jgi:hypothetical protein